MLTKTSELNEVDLNNAVFAVFKNGEKLGFYDNGMDVEDVLTLVSGTVAYAKIVAEETIGLTETELKENIMTAVSVGLGEETVAS